MNRYFGQKGIIFQKRSVVSIGHNRCTTDLYLHLQCGAAKFLVRWRSKDGEGGGEQVEQGIETK